MTLSREDIVAIGDELEARLRKVSAKDGVVGQDRYAITWRQGPLCRTVASDELLPGVVFCDPRLLAKEYELSEPDRAFVKLNCGVDDYGVITAKFGGGFAQPDSVFTNPVQTLFNPFVFHVTYSNVVRGYVLDQNAPVGASADNFPDVYACRTVSPAQHDEWLRLTREDWIGRGWVPGQSGFQG